MNKVEQLARSLTEAREYLASVQAQIDGHYADLSEPDDPAITNHLEYLLARAERFESEALAALEQAKGEQL